MSDTYCLLYIFCVNFVIIHYDVIPYGMAFHGFFCMYLLHL